MPNEQTGENASAWVVASDDDVRAALTLGLADAGVPAKAINIPADMDRASFLEARAPFDQAGARPRLVVIALIPQAALAPASLATMTRETWDALTKVPIQALFHTLQGLLASVAEGPLSIVLLGPSTGHVGAPGLVALSTLLEAQRGVMKSVARQLGARGVTVNWVSIAPEAYDAALGAADLPHGPEIGGAAHALGRVPALRSEIAPVLAMLATPGACVITGVTMNLDGGEWMVP